MTLIYSSNYDSHLEHLHIEFKALKENAVFIIFFKKCSFLQPQIYFLGFLISSKGVSVDPRKIEAILDWPQPKSIKEIQSLLGLASFYRKFIRNFSTIAGPLTECLKATIPSSWGDTQTKNFEELERTLSSTSILRFPDF